MITSVDGTSVGMSVLIYCHKLQKIVTVVGRGWTFIMMCKEAKEREEREGWSLDEILEEERDKREAEAKKRPESERWMEIFWRKKRTYDYLDNNGEANVVDCFLCQKQLKSFGYSEHLEKQHRVIFGVKDIKKASKKYESVPSTSNMKMRRQNQRQLGQMLTQLRS